MRLIADNKELKKVLSEARDKKQRIGFVPTMGFLHEGHCSLIERAKQENDFVVVSIFVNPTQFAPNEDFEKYPRDIRRDEQLAIGAGADIIYFPEIPTIYPTGASTFVEVEGNITKRLCGTSRPSHFKGVTTVVNILFNIVKPDAAYFGQKDAQQVLVIKKMVRDLHMNVEIIVCPIIREADGLAMSSRNVFLSIEERKQAVILSRSLQIVQDAYNDGEKNVEQLRKIVINSIETQSLADIDYVEILETNNLETIELIDGPTLIAVAVRFGKTRLIDNIILA